MFTALKVRFSLLLFFNTRGHRIMFSESTFYYNGYERWWWKGEEYEPAELGLGWPKSVQGLSTITLWYVATKLIVPYQGYKCCPMLSDLKPSFQPHMYSTRSQNKKLFWDFKIVVFFMLVTVLLLTDVNGIIF